MNAFSTTVFNSTQNSNFAALLIDVWIKGVVLLAFAGTVCLCWRRAGGGPSLGMVHGCSWLALPAGVIDREAALATTPLDGVNGHQLWEPIDTRAELGPEPRLEAIARADAKLDHQT